MGRFNVVTGQGLPAVKAIPGAVGMDVKFPRACAHRVPASGIGPDGLGQIRIPPGHCHRWLEDRLEPRSDRLEARHQPVALELDHPAVLRREDEIRAAIAAGANMFEVVGLQAALDASDMTEIDGTWPQAAAGG